MQKLRGWAREHSDREYVSHTVKAQSCSVWLEQSDEIIIQVYRFDLSGHERHLNVFEQESSGGTFKGTLSRIRGQ
jgi:hypothetical protein